MIAIAKFMIKTALFSGIFSVLMALLYLYTDIEIFKILAISLSAVFYHFAMRLAVGYYYHRRYNNHIDYRKKWFTVGARERKFYEKLRVKSWNKHLPTYNTGFFDTETRTYEQIAMAMCQAELVHETIVVYSFIPIVAIIWVGAFEVFLITSILSAVLDASFVALQRYNRPRVIRLIKNI